MNIATLSAQDLGLVVVVVASLGAVVAITVVLASLVRTLRAARAELAEFQTRADELLVELSGTVGDAQHDLERVDDLIGSAEALAATVDGAARVGYLTVGKPVIKTVALAKGTSRAARRIRGSRAG